MSPRCGTRTFGAFMAFGAGAFARFFYFAWRRMDGGAAKVAAASPGSTQG